MNNMELLQQLARQSKISRRDFVSGSLAAGLTVAAATSLFSRSASAEPKKGGHVRFGFGSGATTDSLDPGKWTSSFIQTLGPTFNGYLTEVDNKGRLVPSLAKSWESSPDAKVWTFRLISGAEFHNGKTVQADDVVASIDFHRGPSSESGAKGIVDAIVTISAKDPGTIVFELKEGNADFPFLMSDYHLPILPSTGGKVDPTSKIGCGAYALQSVEFGVRAELVRHPNYWKAGRAWFETVEFLAIKDTVARTSAFLSGKIDVMDRCEFKTVQTLEKDKRFEVLSVTGTQHYTLPMLTDVGPFNDNSIRMALKLAIDREDWLKRILNGHGQLGNDHPISPANRYYAADLPQRKYDPEQAKFYLKKAGLGKVDVTLSVSDAAFAGAVDAAVVYQQSAAAAGINIIIDRQPDDGFWDNVWMKKPWCFSYWGGRPTEDWMFSAVYAKGAGMNETHWDNSKFNQLLIAARSELDETKRRQMYHDMQVIVKDEGGAVVPLFADYIGAISTKIGHDDIGKNWDMDGFLAVERWWLKTA